MQNMNLYQLSLTGLLILWVASLTLIWIRFDRLPHGKFILVAIIIWPFLLMDEWLKASGSYSSLHFLIGMFQFVPALIAGLLTLSVRKLTLENTSIPAFWYFLPAVLMLAGQFPQFLLTAPEKINLLMHPAVGELQVNWMYFAAYLFSAFVLLVFSVNGAELLSNYHHSLSDQVVDVNLYQLHMLSKSFIAILIVAFFSVGLTLLVALALISTIYWQTLVNLLQGATLLFAIMLLLEHKRYSPAPFTAEQIENHKYSDDYLRFVLKQAEGTLIKHKAYKRLGLRIRQLADAAEVEPLALALATRLVLKRNFRAFIYHYRLEYAKKVLMRTDAKVSSVARRLGFDSEKYLSNVFIKYIQTMGKSDKDQPPLG